jgi:uncharacterized membrane protein
MGVVARILIAAAGDGALENIFTSSNFPGIVLLSASGVIGMIFIMRWLVRFQREFTNFYIEENKKLRTEVVELKKEVEAKDDIISELKIGQARLTRLCEEQEARATDHEKTIDRLNRIIERRKLTEEDP